MRHVVVGGKLGREIVENVSRVPESRQENHRPAGAAPIEHFEPDVVIHGYKLDSV
jgi:hypothetical protein